MKIQIQLNRKGSVLQIVLVIFLIMTFALTSCLFMMRSTISHYNDIELLMKQKNLEVLLVSYYIDEMKNSILISDDYTEDDCEVSYTVDDLGDIYEIITYVRIKYVTYSFLVNITTEDFEVKKFEYREES